MRRSHVALLLLLALLATVAIAAAAHPGETEGDLKAIAGRRLHTLVGSYDTATKTWTCPGGITCVGWYNRCVERCKEYYTWSPWPCKTSFSPVQYKCKV